MPVGLLNSNAALIAELRRGGFLKNQRLAQAFKKIDRRDFVPVRQRPDAYRNIPLVIGSGQTISQPLVVALMLELIDPRPGEVILDVGSGSGWTTALLASLVGKRGKVLAIERISELSKLTRENVSKYNFLKKGIVQIICADGSRGAPLEILPLDGFDKILAGAASEKIPAAWKRQLKVSGRIVAPVGERIAVVVKKSPTEFKEREYFGFRFVPLVED